MFYILEIYPGCHEYVREKYFSLKKITNGIRIWIPYKEVVVKYAKKYIVDKIPLFDNYIFVEFDPIKYNSKKISFKLGGKRFIRDHNNKLYALTNDQILKIKLNELRIDRSIIFLGKYLNIIGGVLEGYSGMCVEENKKERWVKVIVDLYGIFQVEQRVPIEFVKINEIT